jgi:hypothetical protein
MSRRWWRRRSPSRDLAAAMAEAIPAFVSSFEATRAQMAEAGFTCPRCGRTSYHPRDRAEGYCGACHDWTGEPR